MIAGFVSRTRRTGRTFRTRKNPQIVFAHCPTRPTGPTGPTPPKRPTSQGAIRSSAQTSCCSGDSGALDTVTVLYPSLTAGKGHPNASARTAPGNPLTASKSDNGVQAAPFKRTVTSAVAASGLSARAATKVTLPFFGAGPMCTLNSGLAAGLAGSTAPLDMPGATVSR